jgi:hypothetical protein
MPTAPNLREIIDKYRPPMPRQGMSRSGSLASQPSAGNAMQAGGGGAPAGTQQRYAHAHASGPTCACYSPWI